MGRGVRRWNSLRQRTVSDHHHHHHHPHFQSITDEARAFVEPSYLPCVSLHLPQPDHPPRLGDSRLRSACRLPNPATQESRASLVGNAVASETSFWFPLRRRSNFFGGHLPLFQAKRTKNIGEKSLPSPREEGRHGRRDQGKLDQAPTGKALTITPCWDMK